MICIRMSQNRMRDGHIIAIVRAKMPDQIFPAINCPTVNDHQFVAVFFPVTDNNAIARAACITHG
ncbi:hypothetical protein CI15_00645 [Paraburkholderia monticola]|uniref:Uncharacterized protein n=1 Tax=Paraburkholderia monticola TaxID=1399968 RepID=A0A149Q1E7_9BURK|nr:hypothetical protein CI15_00645 [Paraburkholderia monticola]